MKMLSFFSLRNYDNFKRNLKYKKDYCEGIKISKKKNMFLHAILKLLKNDIKKNIDIRFI